MKKLSVFLLATLLVVFSAVLIASPKKKAETPAASSKENVVKPKKITAKELKELVYDYEANPDKWVFKGDKPCIIDFYADWCGPCKMIAPFLDELAEEYKGQIVIYKVDVDKEKELAKHFNIRSIPALLFVPLDGDPTMNAGAMPKADLEKQIKTVLLKKAS